MDEFDSRNPNPIHWTETKNEAATYQEKLIFASGFNAGLRRVREELKAERFLSKDIQDLIDGIEHTEPPTNAERIQESENG
jgi:hypothetical protein